MAGRLILDSGAVIALAAGDAAMQSHLRIARERDILVIVPAVIVAETTRGAASDAPVNRALKLMGQIAAIDEPVARLAGRLLRQVQDNRVTHVSPTIDALVGAVAISRGGGTILTGDLTALGALAADHPEVRIRHWLV